LAKLQQTRPGAARSWYKAHGLGNDYLVVEEGPDWALDPRAIERVCDRTHGLGSDGIVLLEAGARGQAGAGERASAAPFRIRIFNPDGSEAERSGNGLRILASYLERTRRVVRGDPFEVEVGGDRVTLEVHDVAGVGTYDVSATMGRASVSPDQVGLARGSLDERGRLEVTGAGRVLIQTVSVGNPHAVVFSEKPTLEELRRLGPLLATHASFAHGTNVQLARVVDSHTVDALVWERGVGHTSASGTSACAVAVAAVHTGRVPPGDIEVRMEGGTLRVRVSATLEVVLRGPVQEVATGELTDGFLGWLSAK
jgi:diaminopimelate epimerase